MSTLLRTSLTLTAFTALASAHWIFGGTRPVVQERLDSVVDAGQVKTSSIHFFEKPLTRLFFF